MHASAPRLVRTQARLWPSRLARWGIGGFLVNVCAWAFLCLLIMSRRIPDFFLFVGQTHVHHLKLWHLLAGDRRCVAVAFSAGTNGRGMRAIIYGVGLGLTFDEFGMWLHLGGSYWQRSSYDAVVVVAGVLALVSFSSDLRRFRLREWLWFLAIVAAMLVAGYLTADAYNNSRQNCINWKMPFLTSAQHLKLFPLHGPTL